MFIKSDLHWGVKPWEPLVYLHPQHLRNPGRSWFDERWCHAYSHISSEVYRPVKRPTYNVNHSKMLNPTAFFATSFTPVRRKATLSFPCAVPAVPHLQAAGIGGFTDLWLGVVNHGESVNPVRYISRTAKKLCFTASKEFFSQLRVVFFVPVESMESWKPPCKVMGVLVMRLVLWAAASLHFLFWSLINDNTSLILASGSLADGF